MNQIAEINDLNILNNLIESQLKIHREENEDYKIFEALLFPDHELTYKKLDQKTSRKVLNAMALTEAKAEKIQCTHCDEVFSEDEFQAHVCLFDENHQLIPIEVLNNTQTEMQKLHNCFMEQLNKNQNFLEELNTKKKNSNPLIGECFKCCRKFVHETGLFRHLDRHIGELLALSPPENPDSLASVTLCIICGEVFGLVNEAWDHLLRYHINVVKGAKHEPVSVEETFVIDLGDFETPKKKNKLNDETSGQVEVNELARDQTQNLLKQIYVTKVFQCEFCDSIFVNSKTAFVHISGHSPSDSFQCKKCELKQFNLKGILLHRRNECVIFRDYRNPLRAFPRVWVCNVCDDEFRGLEQLLEHRHSNHHFFPRVEVQLKKLFFSCELCSIEFSQAPELVNHFNEKHNKKIKLDIVAETSERVPKMPAEIARGGIHQTSTRPRQYLCEVCGKSYTQSSHLWQHLRFHQGVKPFGCSVEGCNRRFTIRPDLNDHVRKCHTGERPYLCTICGKRFLTGSVYYQHRLIHRGERRYGCDECQKRFYRADALKNHLRIHTGEKPHNCAECGKKFRQRGDRDKHMKARHPNAVVIPSPRKMRVKSFGRGRIKNNTSLYCSKPGAPSSRGIVEN